ncbi:hypothetical protein ACTJIL_13245 [Luteimonas sp. 22616]|uniref:hypothetical protein n=1 Tax=Luteimonas sp. 22616 TaxID=3453951 RepID=UPI003F8367D6
MNGSQVAGAGMRFERSEEGLYVPAGTLAKRFSIFQRFNAASDNAWSAIFINGLMVAIQLFTVWVLWLTYQNTVIPTRQKELMSEQLAQLELERKEIFVDIAKAKKAANEAHLVLQQKQRDIRLITAEREKLIRSVQGARSDAQKYLHVAQQATAKAQVAEKGLLAAQMTIFQQHGSMLVSAPRLSYMSQSMRRLVNDVNSSLSGHKHQNLSKYLTEIDSSWPRVDQMVAEVVHLLRNSKSKLFPESYGEELAVYMLKNARNVKCENPDLASLRKIYGKEASAYRAKETKRAEMSDASYVADGLKQGVRYVFTEESMKAREEMIESMADYAGMARVRESVDESTSECFDELESVADSYFKSKGVVAQTIPNEISLR